MYHRLPACIDASPRADAGGLRSVAGGLRSVVATAEELGFAHRLERRCSQRLRPTGRKDAEPPIGDNPAKELQAAPLQVLQVPAGCAVAATTERSPPAPARGEASTQAGSLCYIDRLDACPASATQAASIYPY